MVHDSPVMSPLTDKQILLVCNIDLTNISVNMTRAPGQCWSPRVGW